MSYLVQLLIVCPLIFLAGFIDSIAGGGGLISLPAYAFIGLPMHVASGTGKFVATWGTGIATARFIRNKGYDYRIFYSIPFALLGSALGAWVQVQLSDEVFRYVVLVLIPVAAVVILTRKELNDVERGYSSKKVILLCIIIALALGFYDGFFGPGVGTFLIIAYVVIVGFSTLSSMGNAKIINLSTNVAATVVLLFNGNINFRIAIPAAIFGIAGNYIGSGLAIKNGKKILRPILIVVLVLLLSRMAFDAFA